jgi:ribosomal protein L7/L12
MKLELEGTWQEIEEVCRRIIECPKRKPAEPHIDEQLADIIRQHGIITAIKFYREKTGTSLKAAKDYCDQIRSQIGTLSHVNK